MATWEDLSSYVKRNYRVDEHDGVLRLVFDVGDGRSQMVLLSREALLDGREEWVQIASPFAELGNVSLQRVLEITGGIVCGGAGLVGRTLVLKHAVPLADMSVEEFERPLALVMGTADRLERDLAGGDNY